MRKKEWNEREKKPRCGEAYVGIEIQTKRRTMTRQWVAISIGLCRYVLKCGGKDARVVTEFCHGRLDATPVRKRAEINTQNPPVICYFCQQLQKSANLKLR